MTVTYNKIHPKFKLNGISYSNTELKEVGYSLIKEGFPFEQYIGDFLLDWLANRPTLQVTTSGSTGKPKTIILKKEHMVNSALATGRFFELQPSNTAFLCLPVDFIAGKMMLVRAMVLGLELDYTAASSTPLAGNTRSYDFGAMVPLQLEHSLETIHQIKTLIIGGAPLSEPLREKVQNKALTIYETYGMTETITHIAVKKVNFKTDVTLSEVEHTFKALPNVTLSQDHRDCLVIKAPSIADAPVVTNDIVNLTSDSEFEWLGRYDSIINSGGIKLIPEQIEKKLKKLLNKPFFVAGISNIQLGQKLVLLIEADIDVNTLLQDIQSHGTLSKFEIPKEIYPLSSFVYTKTAKIDRLKTLELIEK